MKVSKHIWITALAVGLCAGVVFAQEEGGPPPPDGQTGGHHRPPPLPIMEALDVNHDGVIDSNEIANASVALKTLDKNGDGRLTQDEYMPARPTGSAGDAPAGHRPPPLPIVVALDINRDGVINANEIANAPAALKTLDKNGDGKLTQDEYMPARPNGPPGDQMEGQPPPPPQDDV